jgi:hypothetical protein
MTAHKFLPGRPVALEALLDQLGILLQRIISLEYPLRCKGDRFPQLRKAANLGLPLMERKLQVKCSLYLPAGGQQSEQPECVHITEVGAEIQDATVAASSNGNSGYYIFLPCGMVITMTSSRSQ